MIPPRITILGGGPVGLAAGYFAKQTGLSYRIFESGPVPGGNAITRECGPFRFDSGAHRLHHKDPEITGVVKRLLGDDLRRVDVPSHVHYGRTLVDFPLSPLNLLRRVGFRTVVGATVDIVQVRLRREKDPSDFEAFAVGRYGRTIADLFLLGYSEKLWSRPCRELSHEIMRDALEVVDSLGRRPEMDAGRGQ